MERSKLRTDYGNLTGDKIRVEFYVHYNANYVKWLEDKLIKLLNIDSASICICGTEEYQEKTKRANGMVYCSKCNKPY